MNYKITEEQVADILTRLEQGKATAAELSREYNLSRQSIYDIRNRHNGTNKRPRELVKRASRVVNKTVKLSSGSLTLAFHGDIFKLTKEDMKLMQVLGEILEHHEQTQM